MKTRLRHFLKSLYHALINAFRRHSIALLLLSALFLYLGKSNWYMQMLSSPGRDPNAPEMGFLAYIAPDLALFAVLIAVIWLLEYLVRNRWIQLLTIAIAVPVTIVSVSNLFWLRGTGNQLSLAVIQAGLSRYQDALPILKSGLGTEGLLLLSAAVAVVVGLPFVFKAKWKKDQLPVRHNPPLTLFLPALLGLLALLGLVEQRVHADRARPGWRLFADNVFLAVFDEISHTAELQPAPTQPPADPERQKGTPRADAPDVLVFIMEAVAHRATSFDARAPKQTPFLQSLAREGLYASQMRAVLPHTTKSIFSILCGQYPSMQMEILETADNYAMQCLPKRLGEHGYRTAFFQTADGRFEDRPRLAHNMGFDHFEALQDLSPRPEPLGYLAGDDIGAVAPLLRWVQRQEGPFMTAVLTSATHHTYDIPKRLLERPELAEAQSWPQPARYMLLVNEVDRVLQQLVQGLRELGRDNLVIITTGDHGEAFGEHGGFQHDNIYTETGLHVPYVVHAPGRIAPQTTVDAARSLLDTTPTVLDLAGVPFDPAHFDGRSLVNPKADNVRRYFACWYTNTCTGFVDGPRKLVFLPTARSWLTYDLARDPDEFQPQVEPPDAKADVADIQRWYHQSRHTPQGLFWSEASLFGGAWQCRAGQNRCRWIKNPAP
ncbi:MAG: sulfatase-like hydrolase/transferase [Proteobacteria bacterium]|nr:sulfatase-like hydrolase/transferase [Pseudomonadota bacterium]